MDLGAGLKLTKAYTYLSDVTDHKQVIPFRRFSGGVGRASQAKQFKATQGALYFLRCGERRGGSSGNAPKVVGPRSPSSLSSAS